MCGAHQYLPLRPVPIIACWSTVMMRQTGPGNYNSIILLEKIRRSSGHQVHFLVPVTNVARAIQMSWQASLSCVTMWQLSWPRLQLLSSPLTACIMSLHRSSPESESGRGGPGADRAARSRATNTSGSASLGLFSKEPSWRTLLCSNRALFANCSIKSYSRQIAPAFAFLSSFEKTRQSYKTSE